MSYKRIDVRQARRRDPVSNDLGDVYEHIADHNATDAAELVLTRPRFPEHTFDRIERRNGELWGHCLQCGDLIDLGRYVQTEPDGHCSMDYPEAVLVQADGLWARR